MLGGGRPPGRDAEASIPVSSEDRAAALKPVARLATIFSLWGKSLQTQGEVEEAFWRVKAKRGRARRPRLGKTIREP